MAISLRPQSASAGPPRPPPPQAVVAVTAAEIPPAGRVMLDSADGAAIVVLDDPRAALRLAERALTATAAGLPLSAGLNHGALQLAGRKGGEGMTGDGIAVAASVAAFAPAARLLASRAFRNALAEAAPGGEPCSRPPARSTILACARTSCSSPTRKRPARRSLRYTAAAMVLAVALVGGGIAAAQPRTATSSRSSTR